MNKDFEKYAYKIIKKYQKILLLDRHIIKIKYGLDIQGSLMECAFIYPYLNATINYGDEVVKKWKNKKDITPYLVHEMCHIITDPLYGIAGHRCITQNELEVARESLTDHICNIILLAK